jgi:hypothetical protein
MTLIGQGCTGRDDTPRSAPLRPQGRRGADQAGWAPAAKCRIAPAQDNVEPCRHRIVDGGRRETSMRVAEEPFSVIREETGVTLLMGGYRIDLTIDEARALVGSVGAALQRGSAEGDAIAPENDPAALVAKVAEQVISWAQIAEAAARK